MLDRTRGAIRVLLVLGGGVAGALGCDATSPGGTGAEAHLAKASAALTRTLTFAPVADARVEAASPNTNFGTATALFADSSPQQESYLRFAVTGVTGRVTGASLRLAVTNSSSNGPALFTAAGGWTETSLTWNTRPARTGAALADLGAVTSGNTVALDVTAAVTGDGELNLALVGTSSDGTDFGSREAAAALRPQLVVTVETEEAPPPPPPPGTRTTSTLAPVADASAEAAAPNRNLGSSTVLLSDNSPLLHAFLRFQVPAFTGVVSQARLRLWVTNPTNRAPTLVRTTTNWTETGLTWNNRPATLATVVPAGGAVPTGAFLEYDVRAAVQGAGEVGFGLLPASSDGVDFVSREGVAARRPQLVIVTEVPACVPTTCEAVGATCGALPDGCGGTLVCGSCAPGQTCGEASVPPNQCGPVRGMSRFSHAVADLGTDQAGGVGLDAQGNVYSLAHQGETVDPERGVLPALLALEQFTPTGARGWFKFFEQAGAPVQFHRSGALAVSPHGVYLQYGLPCGSGGCTAGDLGSGPFLTGVLARFDLDGNLLWVRELGAVVGPFAVGPAGEVVTSAREEGEAHLRLMKLNAAGDRLWEMPYGGARSLAIDPGGNILVGGVVPPEPTLPGDPSASAALGVPPGTAFISQHSPEGVLQIPDPIFGAEGEVVSLDTSPDGLVVAGLELVTGLFEWGPVLLGRFGPQTDVRPFLLVAHPGLLHHWGAPLADVARTPFVSMASTHEAAVLLSGACSSVQRYDLELWPFNELLWEAPLADTPCAPPDVVTGIGVAADSKTTAVVGHFTGTHLIGGVLFGGDGQDAFLRVWGP